MHRRPAKLFLLASAALLAVGIAGALAVVWPVLPIQQRWARERWQQRRPAHYELTVRWNDYAGLVHHLRAEVLRQHIVAVTNLDTGAQLDPRQLGGDQAMLDVDRLFESIAEESRPVVGWRAQIARYHPLLARWIDRCVERLPDVEYNPQYGYPATISYHSDPCQDALAFRTDRRVAVEQLRVLP